MDLPKVKENCCTGMVWQFYFYLFLDLAIRLLYITKKPLV